MCSSMCFSASPHTVLKLYGKAVHIRVGLLCLGGYICSVLLTKCQMGLLQKLYNFTLPPVMRLLMVHILTIVVIDRSLFHLFWTACCELMVIFLFAFSWCFLDYQCGWEYFHASWPLWFPLSSVCSFPAGFWRASHILAWPLSHDEWVSSFCDLPFSLLWYLDE